MRKKPVASSRETKPDVLLAKSGVGESPPRFVVDLVVPLYRSPTRATSTAALPVR